MPSFDDNPESKYNMVISEGFRNYQMYAFCPVPDREDDVCGFGHSIFDFDFAAN